MAAKKTDHTAFEVTCPCCGGMLKIDGELRAVIAHQALEKKMFQDFDEAARALKDQEVRKESIFAQSVEAEKNKASLLEKKFQEALKKAKDTPDDARPLRDIDLG
jgi:Zn-finger nucleic acid-binding protein